jgi:hypothetical protein
MMYQLNFFKLFEHKLLAIFGSPIFTLRLLVFFKRIRRRRQLKLGTVGDCRRNETKRHRRRHAMKLSALGEHGIFLMATSPQIERHRRRCLETLGALGEGAQ